MKKLKEIIVMALCCICFITPLSASAIGVRYTDYKTNLSFMAPSDWSMEKLEDEYSLDKVMFSDDFFIAGTDVIYYNSYDWYKTKFGRKKYLTKEHIAEMYDVNADDIYEVTINDAEYYEIDTEEYKSGQRISTKLLMRLYNGYYFTFQFSTIGNINNKDFDRMMKSVDYSKVVENTMSSLDWFLEIDPLILLGPAIILVGWLNKLKASAQMKSREKRKKEKVSEETEIQNYYKKKITPLSSKTEFCRKCGERLTGEKLCINCGTKVRRK